MRDFLVDRFPDPYLDLEGKGYADLVDRLSGLGITGGAAYDALIATIAAKAGATLLTCDRRAIRTYRHCGADVRLLQ